MQMQKQNENNDLVYKMIVYIPELSIILEPP